jgi:LacI family transcriptional regulator
MGVTRVDVARRAGVSEAVVSYVVNDGPRPVAARTRERVKAAIEELGYRPNVMAKALRGGTTGTVGLLMPSPANPFFAELAEAIEKALVARDNHVLIGIVTGASARGEEYVASFVDRRVDGLIVIANPLLEPALTDVAFHTPIVFLDRLAQLRGSSSVQVENVDGAGYSVEHLQSHGHRVIGCIAGPPGIRSSIDRVDGWRRQQDAAGHDSSGDLVAYGEFTEAGGEAAAHTLLGPEGRLAATGNDLPTALFVSSDIQAIGAMHACAVLGLRIPDDIALVSFDGTKIGQYARPSLTALRQPIHDMADEAVSMILDVHDGRISQPRALVLHGNLVLGESCGCRDNVAPHGI